MRKKFTCAFREADEAEIAGYAKFNGGQHLCVDVPDGFSTISCKLSNGQRVTFSFVPYVDDGVPDCVDIHTPDAPTTKTRDGRVMPQCRVIAFDSGRQLFHYGMKFERGEGWPTLATVILQKEAGK